MRQNSNEVWRGKIWGSSEAYVLHAESDIILPSIEAYFNSDKMYFWMKDGASKDYFLNQLKEQGT
jgi:hypothetical protein